MKKRTSQPLVIALWMMIDLDDPGYGIIRLSKRTLETLATMK